MAKTIADPQLNPEQDRLMSTNRANLKKAEEIHELHSRTFGGRHSSFQQQTTLGGSPKDFFSNKNRRIHDLATTKSIKMKRELNGMNDTYMKKLVSLNQLQRDMSDGDKYYMSPHINGDRQCPWKLQKKKQPEKAESIKSKRNSIKSVAPNPIDVMNDRDQQYLDKFNKDMLKTIERIEQKNSPRVFEPLQRIDEQTLKDFNK